LARPIFYQAKYEDDYALMLQREYRFLKKKYQLAPFNKNPLFYGCGPLLFPPYALRNWRCCLHGHHIYFSMIKEIKGL
jgi:hypothetical protein